MLKVMGKSVVQLEVNGSVHDVTVRPADTLLHVLRHQLGLTGAKDGCGNGDCDTCTVLVDGEPIKSCLMLAVEAIGQPVTTVEALQNEKIQTAFVQKFAVQCGYCTPGLMMNCHALISSHTDVTDDVLAEWLEANTCRCTGYQEIKEAIRAVVGVQSSVVSG